MNTRKDPPEKEQETDAFKETTAFLRKIFRQPDLTIEPGNNGTTRMLVNAIAHKVDALEKERSNAKGIYQAARKAIALKKKYPDRKETVLLKDYSAHDLRRTFSFYGAQRDFFKQQHSDLQSDINQINIAKAVLKNTM